MIANLITYYAVHAANGAASAAKLCTFKLNDSRIMLATDRQNTSQRYMQVQMKIESSIQEFCRQKCSVSLATVGKLPMCY